MEQPQRSGLSNSEVYLCYDAQNVILFVGRTVDPYYLFELFEVDDVGNVALNRTEEVMFGPDRLAASQFLTNLYGLINQIRYQRQPFCSMKVLVAGDQLSEQTMQQLCVLDSRIPTYNKEWSKFIHDCSVVSANQGNRTSNPGVPANYY